MIGGHDADDLESGAVASEQLEFTATEVRRKPEGWHKPRKQHIRAYQWRYEISQILKKRDPDAQLTYLGLPGHDLLDVRDIYNEFCKQSGRPLRFLGFDKAATPQSPNHAALRIAEREVRALPGVDGRSGVRQEDIRIIGNRLSQARAATKSAGPFDVVNLDLCDHFASDEPGSNSLYEAIREIVSLQTAQPDNWALFLTTRVGATGMSHEARDVLLNLLYRNVDECEGFAEAWTTEFEAVPVRDELESWDGMTLFQVVATALGKWLVHVACPLGWECRLTSLYGYRVYDGAERPDMLSAAFRFVRVPGFAPDRSGLTVGSPAELDECEFAVELPAAVAKWYDADEEMRDPMMLASAITQSKALLESAGYDVSDYEAEHLGSADDQA
jgi:hypothetical protein